MVTETLVNDDIQKGKDVIRALDKSGIKVAAAFWLYKDEVWHLVLAMPLVDRLGKHEGYKRVQSALSQHGVEKSVPLRLIRVVGVQDPQIKDMRRHVKTGKRDVAGIRVDDAYVYRSTGP